MVHDPPPAVTHSTPDTKGPALAIAAVLLGVLGCAMPLLPIDLTGVRAYVGLPFAFGGLGLAVLGLRGTRRGKPLAVVGAVLSVLALLLGMYMAVAHGMAAVGT